VSNLIANQHQETLNRLAASSISIYRTDQDGDIEMQTDGTSVSITTER